jgi:hypothetical protein
MKKELKLVCFALIIAPTLGGAMSITELGSNMLEQNRRLEVAIQDIRIASSRLVQQEAENYWKVNANLTGSSTVESHSQPGKYRYLGTYGYNLGTSYPLLGSRSKQEKMHHENLLAIHERTLRSQSLPGDEIEKRLQAGHQYFRMASQLLELRRKSQFAGIRLVAYGHESTESPISPPSNLSLTLSDTNRVVSNATTQLVNFSIPAGVYIWNSKSLLKAPVQNLVIVKKYGLSRILIGLDSKQIVDPNLKKYIQQLLNIAHQKQINVEIVLGDPNWITPEKRPDLISLLKRLSPLAVDGFNLDLEIEQFPDWESRREILVTNWLDTLRAASSVIQSPLGATFHHRHLLNPEFGERLRSAGVNNASIMIFTTGKDRVLEVAALAQQVLNTLDFSIAQSVERALPVTESYYTLGLKPLVNLSQSLNSCCSTSLLIQAWDDLITMKP